MNRKLSIENFAFLLPIFIYVIIVFISAFSCKENTIYETITKTDTLIINDTVIYTSVPQFDVYSSWLSNSTWPRYRNNAQSTGRSRYSGPKLGIIDKTLNYYCSESSVVIDERGNIYFFYNNGKGYLSDYKYLIAIDKDGNKLWEHHFDDDLYYVGLETSSVIASDGTIYTTGYWGYNKYVLVYAFTSEGRLKWKYKIPHVIIQMGLNVGINNVLYICTNDQYLYAINPDGTLKFSKYLEETGGPTYGSVSFSNDGQTMYMSTINYVLVAYDLDGNLKWKFMENNQNPRGWFTPLVDSYGNIFIVGSSGLYSVSPEGDLLWKNDSDGAGSEICMDNKGYIYAISYLRELLSFDYCGHLRWKRQLDSWHSMYLPIVDKDGDIYVCDEEYTRVDSNAERKIWSYSSNGDLNWKITLKGFYTRGCPAIDADGRMYVANKTENGKFLIIK